MGKPFKNIASPAPKCAPSAEPLIPKNVVSADADRTVNGTMVNEKVSQDGETPIKWPAADNGKKPMKLKGE